VIVTIVVVVIIVTLVIIVVIIVTLVIIVVIIVVVATQSVAINCSQGPLLYTPISDMSICCIYILYIMCYHILLQTEYARFENGRFVYRIHRSPMCDYMITFIHKLKQLPEKYMMNSVLENFTILQVRR